MRIEWFLSYLVNEGWGLLSKYNAHPLSKLVRSFSCESSESIEEDEQVIMHFSR